MVTFTLPAHWRLAKLGEIVNIGSRNVDPNQEPERLWNYVALENVEQGTGHLVGFSPSLGRQIGSTKALFKNGDVLYGKLRPYLRKAWVAEFDGCSSTDLIPLTPGPDVLAEYLKWFLLSPLHMEYITPLMAGIRMPRLRSDGLQDMPIPLPPVTEQRRIIARIEEMSERSRRARRALASANQDAIFLRQALLHITWNGELSAAWREACQGMGTTLDLLVNCEYERELRWKDAGYTPTQVTRKRSALKGRYDVARLDVLPESWRWVTLSDLAWEASYGTSVKCEIDGEGEPVLRIPNILGGQLDLSDLKNATAALSLDAREYLKPGDFLIVRTNGSVGLIGRAALVRHEELSQPHFYASYLIRYRLACPQVLQEWVSLIWHAPKVREQIELLAASSAGQYNLSLDKIASVAIPIPPLEECAYLVGRLQQGFEQQATTATLCRAVEADLDHLEASILSAAFSGEL